MKAKKKVIKIFNSSLNFFPPMDSHFLLSIFSLSSAWEFKLLQRFTQLLFLYKPDEKLQISANHCKILDWRNTLIQLEAWLHPHLTCDLISTKSFLMLSNPSSFFLSHVDFISHSLQLLSKISPVSCQATRRSWHCCLLDLDGRYPEQALSSSHFNSQPLYMFTHF